MEYEVPDCYEYPNDLYCVTCDEYVEPLLEKRVEHMQQNGKPVDIPWTVALCPKCRNMVCDKDLDYGILRQAKKDGLMK